MTQVPLIYLFERERERERERKRERESELACTNWGRAERGERES